MTEPVLRIDGLCLTIDGAAVVDGLSLAVQEREIVAVVGESGCGKSLSALAVLRLLPPAVRLSGGSITLCGRDVIGMGDSDLAGLRGRVASIIFQEPTASLDPLTTVGSQIVEALLVHQRFSRAIARQRAKEMLVSVGIADPDRRLDQYPFELSGGMCQRIMIAIALINEPKLLIADEPTTALDVTIQAQILNLMKDLAAEHGTAVLIITHDMGVVADMADRVVVMYAGRVVETAPVEIIFKEPQHPYTALLLASVPRSDFAPKSRLATIDGTVPQPADFGSGCRFAGRCPLADVRCRSESPPLTARGPDHSAACWHADRTHSLRSAA